MFIQGNAFEIVACRNGGHFVQGEMSKRMVRTRHDVQSDSKEWPLLQNPV